MTPKYYHTPPPSVPTRVRCPVCHEAVYSRGGIHPQCAVRRADPPRSKVKPAELAVPTETGPAIDADAAIPASDG